MTVLPCRYRVYPPTLNLVDWTVTAQVLTGRGDSPAITAAGTTLTYAQLDEQLSRYANALGEIGLARGDRLLILTSVSTDAVATVLGCMAMGATAVPIGTLLRAGELHNAIETSQPALVVVEDSLREPLDEACSRCTVPPRVISLAELGRLAENAAPVRTPVPTAADECAFAIYTSGSTGLAKSVEHAHRTLVTAGDPVVYHQLGLQPGTRICTPIGLGSLIALDFGLLFPLYAGAHTVMFTDRFSPDAFARHLAAESVEIFAGVPTLFRRMLQDETLEQRHDLSSVRFALCGGEAMDMPTFEGVQRRFGFPIYEMIGSTEAQPYIANPVDRPPRLGSMGTPLAGRVCTILNAEGSESDIGETGHLCLRADDPALALGYRHRQDEWRALQRDGWFYTGDLAYRDSDDYYWFVGRADDVIISRAYRISPEEVEREVRRHDAVVDAVVVGVPDPVVGARVRAYVVLHETYLPSDELRDDIIAMVARSIAPYKAPKDLDFIDSIPQTTSGKLMRSEIKKLIASSTGRSELHGTSAARDHQAPITS